MVEITPGSETCRVWTLHPEGDDAWLLYPTIADFFRVLVDIETMNVTADDDGEGWIGRLQGCLRPIFQTSTTMTTLTLRRVPNISILGGEPRLGPIIGWPADP